MYVCMYVFELSLVKIKLLSKTLLHCVTPYSNMHKLDNQCSYMFSPYNVHLFEESTHIQSQ